MTNTRATTIRKMTAPGVYRVENNALIVTQLDGVTNTFHPGVLLNLQSSSAFTGSTDESIENKSWSKGYEDGRASVTADYRYEALQSRDTIAELQQRLANEITARQFAENAAAAHELEIDKLTAQLKQHDSQRLRRVRAQLNNAERNLQSASSYLASAKSSVTAGIATPPKRVTDADDDLNF